jgi:hypothetical protein
LRFKSPLDEPAGAFQNAAVQSRLFLVLVAILTVDVVLGLLLYLHWRNHHFDADIKAAARRYGVDPELVRAVVWQESRFNSQARGRTGLGTCLSDVNGLFPTHYVEPRASTPRMTSTPAVRTINS